MRQIARNEWVAVVGLLLIGIAIYLAFGVAALLAYAGTVCVVVGIAAEVAAIKRG